MRNGPNFLARVRYLSSVTAVYAVTLLFGWFVFHPQLGLSASRSEVLIDEPNIRVERPANYVSGIPVRIVLPTIRKDLPVDKGFYDPVANSWTLASFRAQWATISAPANNWRGNTFVYGHNNKEVFTWLMFLQPGDPAIIYTDNGHIFTYTYENNYTVDPNDTSIFNYHGKTILTIQTCSGNWYENRQFYKFKFSQVQ